jgi:hypothetical protein
VNLLAPQTVHATVAALVNVANTASNPALTSRIDDPGRIPYQTEVECGVTGKQCSFLFGAVPANHRLVIEHISGMAVFTTAPSFSAVFLNKNLSGPVMTQFYSPLTVGSGALFDQPVRVYLDQGQSYTVSLLADTAPSSGQFQVSGYLLDCNAAPCVAIFN